MTFLIAAAGTGGHVFPGLSVGQALIDRGVPRADVLFVGGSRLESSVFPEAGFPFLEIEIRGLQRSFTPRNAALPFIMSRARDQMASAMSDRSVKAALGMGGYITIPAGLAARRMRIPFFNSEQNARSGLANRVAARWARSTFGAFPVTDGLPTARWVGNPVRKEFWDFDRATARPESLKTHGLQDGIPTLGVVGGSLGAGAINNAVVECVTRWTGPGIQVLHLTGNRFLDAVAESEPAPAVTWIRKGFEPAMETFYAVCDLVLARAGGAVAELTATATPSILVPGDFGSSGHQNGNARFLTDAGAAITLGEHDANRLGEVIAATLFRPEMLEQMRKAAREIARPRAAHEIGDAMIEAVG